MNEVKIVYWSGTGNTEQMASIIADGIKEAGKEVSLINVSNANIDEILKEDLIVLGCPSMGNEELEESEMEPFVADIEKSLSGKKVALFGSYGWGSGEWMESWEERMKAAGSELVGEKGIICNETPSGSDIDELKEFGKIIAESM